MKIEQTFNITDFAALKNCTRQTVYSNIDKLDVDARKKIIWNAKSQKWQPDKKMTPKKYR
jgi:hypothetical protein